MTDARETLLRRLISEGFPLYEGGAEIWVKDFPRGFAAGYRRGTGDDTDEASIYVHEPEGGQRVCDFMTIGIREDWRNKGHGTRLYEAFEQFALLQGCTTMELVPKDNGSVQEYWEHRGFTSLSEECMQKDIERSTLRATMRSRVA